MAIWAPLIAIAKAAAAAAKASTLGKVVGAVAKPIAMVSKAALGMGGSSPIATAATKASTGLASSLGSTGALGSGALTAGSSGGGIASMIGGMGMQGGAAGYGGMGSLASTAASSSPLMSAGLNPALQLGVKESLMSKALTSGGKLLGKGIGIDGAGKDPIGAMKAMGALNQQNQPQGHPNPDTAQFSSPLMSAPGSATPIAMAGNQDLSGVLSPQEQEIIRQRMMAGRY